METKSKELLFSLSKEAGDFVVQATKGSGVGGQNRNKRETACRVTHPKSGAVGFCQEERYFGINRERAFKRCVESQEFQKWLKLETAARIGNLQGIDAEVERQMHNVKMEVRDENGRFVEVGEEYFDKLELNSAEYA